MSDEIRDAAISAFIATTAMFIVLFLGAPPWAVFATFVTIYWITITPRPK